LSAYLDSIPYTKNCPSICHSTTTTTTGLPRFPSGVEYYRCTTARLAEPPPLVEKQRQGWSFIIDVGSKNELKEITA